MCAGMEWLESLMCGRVVAEGQAASLASQSAVAAQPGLQPLIHLHPGGGMGGGGGGGDIEQGCDVVVVTYPTLLLSSLWFL